MNFAQLLKDLRARKRLTLRDCADALDADPSNWSKFERGILPAPKDEEVLSAWAEFFGLHASDRQEFLDAAALSRNQLPADLAADPALMAKLPAFFRAMRGKELEGEKLDAFVEDLRKLHRP
jgi:transcriptional regulator with XRE-family HTH domain